MQQITYFQMFERLRMRVMATCVDGKKRTCRTFSKKENVLPLLINSAFPICLKLLKYDTIFTNQQNFTVSTIQKKAFFKKFKNKSPQGILQNINITLLIHIYNPVTIPINGQFISNNTICELLL